MMGRVFAKMPIQTGVVVPFPPLPELIAHEQHFLTRMAVHIAVERAEIGELLPEVAGHFSEERAFPMDDFVMRENEDEVFGKGVEQAERHLVLMELPMHRLMSEVVERVMHPSHVPFERKPEPSGVGGAGDPRPGGGLFRNGHRAGEVPMHEDIQLFEQRDGAEVFIAAELIGDPFAGFAPVVEIEHRGDGIHAYSVDVIGVEPEQCTVQEKVAHLRTVIIEDPAVPIRVVAEARIGMVIEMGAVEKREAVRIVREMRGRPVHDDPDTGCMGGIDKRHEVFRRAVAAGRRKIAGGLIAPGSIKGMFSDRKEFNMGVAEVLYIGNESGGQLVVGEPAILLFRHPHP